ncbi:MAG: murein biosynthesis integral membrane protein MurJ [Spirochaetia bacterium]
MKEESTGQSTIATFIVMSSTFVSRILGFLRTAAITAIFGATGKADIINVTFAIPNNLRKLLAEGALSSAFIPVLSEAIIAEGKEASRSRQLVRHLIGFQLLIIIPLCIVSVVFAEPLIQFVLTQFKDAEQLALSTKLFRFFINYLLFISVSAVLIGVLNSHGRFFIPSITPIIFSVAVISSIIVLHRTLGIYSMAVGVLVGGAGQVAFQYPMFRKMGYTLAPAFDFLKNPDFMRIMRQWAPVVATSSVFTVNQQVAFIFASGLETGSASALSYALVFWQLPFGIFSTSITTVLFPKMSRQVSQNDLQGLRESVQYGIRFLLALLIPSALVMSLLGREIISVAIQRGMFRTEDTELTAFVLTGFCYGLFSVGAFNFLQRYFYSSNQYSFPFYVALGVLVLDVTLSIILKKTFLRVAGLSIANSISFSLGLIVLFAYAYRQLGGIPLRSLALTALKVCAASVPVGLVIYQMQRLFGPYWRAGSSFTGFGILLLEIGVIVALYLLLYRLLRVEMLSYLFKRFKQKAEKEG